MAKGFQAKQNQTKNKVRQQAAELDVLRNAIEQLQKQFNGLQQTMFQMYQGTNQQIVNVQREIQALTVNTRFALTGEGAKEGDRLVIDCLTYLVNEDGTHGPEYLPGMSFMTSNIDLILEGPGIFFPELMSNLKGKKAGDVFQLTAGASEEADEGLKGKTFYFDVTVLAVLAPCENNDRIPTMKAKIDADIQLKKQQEAEAAKKAAEAEKLAAEAVENNEPQVDTAPEEVAEDDGEELIENV